jgi:hypothetical protein
VHDHGRDGELAQLRGAVRVGEDRSELPGGALRVHAAGVLGPDLRRDPTRVDPPRLPVASAAAS